MTNEQIYKQAAERLWRLLDDVDTLTDVIKPTSLKGYISFYESAMVRVKRRHEVLVSDGYSLHVPESCEQKIAEVALPKEEEKTCGTCRHRLITCTKFPCNQCHGKSEFLKWEPIE